MPNSDHNPNPISNKEDTIDSRDIIGRIEYLEIETLSKPLDAEERKELAALKDLAKQAEVCPDWIHGETLIRRSYFEHYIAELIDDCYDLPAQLKSGEWPYRHIQIDIEAAAQEAEQDYIEVTFDGVEYLIRA